MASLVPNAPVSAHDSALSKERLYRTLWKLKRDKLEFS